MFNTRMSKVIIALLIMFLMAGAVPVFANGETEKAYTIKLSHHAPLAHFYQAWALDFAKIVAEKSNNQIKVEVFGGGTLGGLSNNTEGVSLGTIDMAIVDYSTIGTFYPKAGFISLPFLWKSYSHVENFYDGDLNKQLKKEILTATNIRVLSNTHAGFRIIMSTRPINSVDDMKLLKIRVPESPLYVNTFKALGCNTIVLPAGEIYTSLQTNVIEAAEGPSVAWFSFKLQEVTKYIAKTYHIYTDSALVINGGVYDSMPADLRAVIDQAAIESTAKTRKQVQMDDDTAYESIVASGLQETKPNMKAFIEKMKPVWDDFAKKADSQDLIDAVAGLQ